jgi:hypothetical protein
VIGDKRILDKVIGDKRILDKEGASDSGWRQAEPALVIRHMSYTPKASIEAQDRSAGSSRQELLSIARPGLGRA